MADSATVLLNVTTTGGLLLVLAPGRAGGGLAAGLCRRWAPRPMGRAGDLALGLAIASVIALVMLQTGGPLVYLLGGWAPPLGVALRADGLSVVMMVITAVVICAIGVFARADFRTPPGSVRPARRWRSGSCCSQSGER